MVMRFVFLLLLALGFASAKDSSDLVLPHPRKVVKEKGGRILGWDRDATAFEEIGVKSEIIHLKPNGLVLPMYVDADSLCYVLEGRATAGIVRPSGEATNTRYVRVGDVVALPAGWMVWLWNTGGLGMKMFCVNKPVLQEDCKSCKTYFLAGSEESKKGSFLHGFSDEVLKRTFQVDMKEARSIVEAQKSSVFADAKEFDNEVSSDQSDNGEMRGDLSFNMEIAHPDVIESGGRMTLLDDTKMRILEHLSFGAVRVKLNPSSMFAPQWLLGSGQIVYVTKGKGRVEVATQEGQAAIEQTVDAGDVFVVPPYHPHAVVNTGSSPMEWICIHFTSSFYPSFLSGSRSVYASIPLEVLSASLNTSDDVADMVRSAHASEKMFFTLDRGFFSIV
ncbi:11S globulin seed storage protein 2 [Selaginella moellendorffii]|uniref:11S globulin seed storage protein 2 n=1 Tax=Selaginella moellendorffii TaxID=88036 RepID=UPI000D1C6729|nr:11S globulin seed storage protein 2 [Selaginella moellendorffii]|eukprot:XP_024538425.1 11S globulin seed storage protein 2 [Selaginella moellendorffii]